MATGKRIVQKDILSKLRQSQGFQTLSVMKIAATNWRIRFSDGLVAGTGDHNEFGDGSFIHGWMARVHISEPYLQFFRRLSVLGVLIFSTWLRW